MFCEFGRQFHGFLDLHVDKNGRVMASVSFEPEGDDRGVIDVPGKARNPSGRKRRTQRDINEGANWYDTPAPTRGATILQGFDKDQIALSLFLYSQFLTIGHFFAY